MNRSPIIVIAPDSFKGSLSGSAAATAIEAGVRRAVPSAEVRLCPMADGGEGTMDGLLALGGNLLGRNVRDAAGVRRPVALGILANGAGIIEVARVVGITDAPAMQTAVGARSSIGVGDAVLALLDHGCTTIQIALGGSSTNDGGAGMLVALGLRLLDEDGVPVPSVPSELARVAAIDASGLDARLLQCRLVAMTDVENPLTGPDGATFIFGPQKGVLPRQLAEFDTAIAKFARLCEAAVGRSVASAPGAGAAGGLGFAVQLLGGVSVSGAAMVADLVGLDAAFQGAALAITGEGTSDAQTLQGKAPALVARRARLAGVPTVLISGAVDRSSLASLNDVFAGCFSIMPGPMSLDAAIVDAASLLSAQAEQVVRIFFGVVPTF